MSEINQSLSKKDENRQPANLEAEQALLGSILVNNDILDEISNFVNPQIFYDPSHMKIFEVIQHLNNKGMIANPITLKNFFEKENILSEVGGTEYLVKLTRFSGSTKQANDYAKIIHEMYLRRELILISNQLNSDTLNVTTFLDEIITSTLVFGFLPILVFLFLTLKIPKFTIFTSFFFLRLPTTKFNIASKKTFDSLLDKPIDSLI